MEQFRQYLPLWLQQHGYPLNKAFRCLSPTHTDKHPSMRYYARNQTVHCFACGVSYDLFDLLGQEYGLSSFPEKLEKARQLYGSREDAIRPVPVVVRRKKTAGEPYREKEGIPHAYFASRGIGDATVVRYGLRVEDGYAVLPVFRGGVCCSVCRRALDDAAPVRYRNSKGSMELWNGDALAQHPVVFVTEGIFDALSLIECGAAAVALCGAANEGKLRRRLEELTCEHRPQLVAAGDADQAGQQLNLRLARHADELRLCHAMLAVPAPYKDLNEWLLADRAGLQAAVQAITDRLRRMPKSADEETDPPCDPLEQGLLAFVENRRRYPPLSTGLAGLDALLEGGIPPGLTVLGSKSSMGKTTLLLQLADRFAVQGRQVLFFTVEMSRYELLAKSLARLPQARACGETARALLDGKVTADRLQRLFQAYREATGGRVHFEEPEQPLTPALLLQRVEEFAVRTGQKPVILLDYLQLMAPARPAATDKQNADAAVAALKQLVRRYDTAVLAASSFNREAYDGGADMKAFKESGLVEYSADLLLALQLREKGAEPAARQGGERRSVELVVLKNRFGKAGAKAQLCYLPAEERFEDAAPCANQLERPARKVLR